VYPYLIRSESDGEERGWAHCSWLLTCSVVFHVTQDYPIPISIPIPVAIPIPIPIPLWLK